MSHIAVNVNFGPYKLINPLITWYYVKGQYETLHYIKSISPDCYVIFIGYKDADMQPGITGSVTEGESYEKATIRELEEEIGFTAQICNLQPIDTSRLGKVGRQGNVYILNAKNCIIAENIKILKKGFGRSPNKKIALLVYGSKDIIMNMLMKAKPIDPGENIDYYGCIHIDHAMKMTEGIKFRRIKGITKEFKYTEDSYDF